MRIGDVKDMEQCVRGDIWRHFFRPGKRGIHPGKGIGLGIGKYDKAVLKKLICLGCIDLNKVMNCIKSNLPLSSYL